SELSGHCQRVIAHDGEVLLDTPRQVAAEVLHAAQAMVPGPSLSPRRCQCSSSRVLVRGVQQLRCASRRCVECSAIASTRRRLSRISLLSENENRKGIGCMAHDCLGSGRKSGSGKGCWRRKCARKMERSRRERNAQSEMESQKHEYLAKRALDRKSTRLNSSHT